VYGTTEPNWVAATSDLPGAGALELEHTGGDPSGRAMVGGDWANEAAGMMQADVGLNWVATGDPVPPGFAAGVDTRGMLDDWRNLFNPHSPSFWAAACTSDSRGARGPAHPPARALRARAVVDPLRTRRPAALGAREVPGEGLVSTDALATGVVLVALGVWLILRTVTHDDHGRNLVDRVLAL
jgi:hypothetical protein